MFNEAVRLFAADWVLCLDADEFIDDTHVEGGFAAALDRLQQEDPAALCLSVPLIEYQRAPTDISDEINVPLRLTHKHPPFGVDKVFVSGKLTGPNVLIGDGNHFAALDGEKVPSSEIPGLRLAHFAERSPHQLAAKWIRGWSKVLAAGPAAVARGTSVHYRGQFEAFRDDPASLLRDPGLMQLWDDRPMTQEAMAYRGGPLSFTHRLDDTMRAVGVIVGHLEELASRYGRLLEGSPEAAALIKTWDSVLKVLLGERFIPPEPALVTPDETVPTMAKPQPAAASQGWLSQRFARRFRGST